MWWERSIFLGIVCVSQNSNEGFAKAMTLQLRGIWFSHVFFSFCPNMHLSHFLQPTQQNQVLQDLVKTTSGQGWVCKGEEGEPGKPPALLCQQRNSQPGVQMLIPGAAVIAEGHWEQGWLWAAPEPISCFTALIHQAPLFWCLSL